MKKYVTWLLALVASIAMTGQLRAADYYIDALGGSDVAAGTSAAPWKSLDRLRASAYTPVAGDRIFLAGTFRGNEAGSIINKLKMKPAANMYIGQWPGKPQAVIRGDIVPAAGSWAGAAGVYTITLPQADNTWGETDGIADYVAGVVRNWDTRIDSLGRHYGHLTRATGANDAAKLAAVVADSYLYFYDADGADNIAGNGDDRLLKIGISAAETPTSTVIGWLRGNVDGIELGTPSYETLPAHNSALAAATLGAYNGTTVNNLVLEGIHAYLWADSGFGARASTISIGYNIRVADGVNCIIRGCTTIDGGYHEIMYVGDACFGNTIINCVMWGGAPNTSSGNSTTGFYSGPGGGLTPTLSHVDKCVLADSTMYMYWHLGVDGNPLAIDSSGASTATTGCDGVITHTNNRGDTTSGDPSTDAGDIITPTTSNPMYNGESIYIVSTTASGITAGQSLYVVGRTSTTFQVALTSGGAAINIGTGTVYWYSLSNRVLDVEVRNCVAIQSGKISDSTMCKGSPFIQGGRTAFATNPLDWRAYPVRYIDCEIRNGMYNIQTGDGDVAYYRCKFSFPRMGLMGLKTASGGNLCSVSSYASAIYVACEIVAVVSNASDVALFYPNFNRWVGNTVNASNNTYLINCSLLMTGDRTSAGGRYFLTNVNDPTTANVTNRFYARGTIFAHQWCKSTTATAIGNTGLVKNNGVSGYGDRDNNNDGTNDTAADIASNNGGLSFHVRDCMYVNVGTSMYIPYGGGGNNLSVEFSGDNYKEHVDPDGIYIDATSGGRRSQDPTEANINLGWGPKMPYQDPTGITGLRLNGIGASYQKFNISATTDFGINKQRFNGRYGCYQDGPAWWKYLIPARNRNN